MQSDILGESVTEVFGDRARRTREASALPAPMRLAREAQIRMFPDEAPPMPGFDLAGASFASHVFDGDFFDFVPLPGGRLVLVIGDACGHGLGAAMVMVQACACVRSLLSMTDDIEEVLGRAGSLLHASMLDAHFVTMLLIELDSTRGRLRWVNAAHPPALLLDASGRVRQTLGGKMLPLGIRPEARPAPPGECAFRPGETLLALTDGVLDATTEDRNSPGGHGAVARPEPLGVEGVVAAVQASPDATAVELVERIYLAAAAHAAAPVDDMTIVSLRRLAEAERSATERQPGAA